MDKTIGKVKISYDHYKGRDLYCDGPSEDRLLEAVKESEPGDNLEAVYKDMSFEFLYHLSPLRENVVEWIDIKEGAKILEVGSGCGAVTGAIAAKAGSLTCVELSEKRSLINAYRHRDLDNIEIRLGNFEDVEKDLDTDYDCIFLIGVLEYGELYISGEDPYVNFLKILKNHLKKDGFIVCAIENRLGLKYFAGAAEDHSALFFQGIEGYDRKGPAKTFSKPVLDGLFASAGFLNRSFYYPYPDYKFPKMIFSDERMPKAGEIREAAANPDRNRALIFNEAAASYALSKDGLYDLFANSFIVLAGDVKLPDKTVYVRYSNDRINKYTIATEIVKTGGVLSVIKRSLSKKADEHVEKMLLLQDRLKAAVSPEFKLLEGKDAGGKRAAVSFPFLEEKTLEEMLDEKIKEGDAHGFTGLLKEAASRFEKAFKAEEICDRDPAFSNIFVSGDEWILTDHEWIFEKKPAGADLFLRALYCYEEEDRALRSGFISDACRELNIASRARASAAADEMIFQKEVTGGRLSFEEICERLGRKKILFDDVLVSETADKGRIQIYEDRGNGFSESDSYFLKAESDGDTIRIETDFDTSVKSFRFDPGMEPCILRLTCLCMDDKKTEDSLKLAAKYGKSSNAAGVNGDTFLFDNEDPNITFNTEGHSHFVICFERTAVNKKMIESLCRPVKRGIFGR